ncbi:MAG: biotin synthase BioB [Planctomycetaceae bacterium]|jgi:biotin synthase|nr:biotin synthase BioB [Planctomycetaceae bacterium]
MKRWNSDQSRNRKIAQQKMITDIIHAPLEDVLNEAQRVRSETHGTDIDLCAIVNIKSGRCAMDCRFCAQSQYHGTSVDTYPILSSDELAVQTQKLWKQDIPRVGWVSSGCTPAAKELDAVIASAMPLLTAAGANRLCASLGQLETAALRKLQSAGFDRYHHNLETSERFYPSICTTQRWRDRRATVERVKELGWTVCSGGLFGLGETWEDRRELAQTLQKLEVDSVPINFFHPIPGTPLADRPVLTPEEALRIVALFRLTLPKATIRICGGRPAVFASPQRAGDDGVLAAVPRLIRAGANAFMTGNYLTTSGISPEKDREMIAAREPATASP